MGERRQIVILSPLDLKRGSVAPDGRVIKKSTMIAALREVVVDVEFEDGTSGAYMWPNGSGWTVDGRKAP